MTDFDENADYQELTTCSHDVCNCTLMGPTIGETYCSSACREAEESGVESEMCPCGHPQCDAA